MSAQATGDAQSSGLAGIVDFVVEQLGEGNLKGAELHAAASEVVAEVNTEVAGEAAAEAATEIAAETAAENAAEAGRFVGWR